MRSLSALTVCGIILFLIGILALAYQGIIFGTATASPNQPEPWAWILSAVAVLVGLVLMMFGRPRTQP